MGTLSWLGFNWKEKKALLWWQSSPCSLLMASSTQMVTSHLTYISFVSPLPFLYRRRVRITTRLSFQEFLKMERTWVEVLKKKKSCTPKKSTSSRLTSRLNLHTMTIFASALCIHLVWKSLMQTQSRLEKVSKHNYISTACPSFAGHPNLNNVIKVYLWLLCYLLFHAWVPLGTHS